MTITPAALAGGAPGNNTTSVTRSPRNTNVYLFVKNDAGQSNASGYVIQITPPPAVLAYGAGVFRI